MFDKVTGDTIFWDEPDDNLDKPPAPGNVVFKIGSGLSAELEAEMWHERRQTITGQECYQTPRLVVRYGVSMRVKLAIVVLTIICIAIVWGISQGW